MAPLMRPEDKQEVSLMNHGALEALLEGVRASDSLTVVHPISKRPCIVFGSHPDPSNPYLGFVWMLASKEIEDIKYEFIRGSKYWLKYLWADYKVLHNYVWRGNELHLRWLQWLGAKFHSRIPVRNEEFIHFYFIR